jgi:hypothetical protein
MAEPGSVRKDTAGHMFENLSIQESTQATKNQEMQQLGAGYCSGYGMFWKGFPTLDGCTTFTSEVTPGRGTLIP